MRNNGHIKKTEPKLTQMKEVRTKQKKKGAGWVVTLSPGRVLLLFELLALPVVHGEDLIPAG